MPDATAPVSWRLNAERLVLLGWARAMLLQFAHPLVAQGVADHSTFRTGGLSAARRLHHTVRAMLSLSFGSPAERDAALAGIKAIHRRVNGSLPRTVGPFTAGTRYSAEDPELVGWVHLTLLDSIPLVYELFIEPISEADRDTFCREAAWLAHALGVPDGMTPLSWSGVREALDRTYTSGRIVVGPTARDLAASVLHPPLARLIAPATYLNRLLTIGLLPPQIRAQYGFQWNARRERVLQASIRLVRGARRAMPDMLALWPEARPFPVPDS
jgi:uncharacterized protein (DUF2236 family)